MGPGSTPLESLPLLQASSDSSQQTDSAQADTQQPGTSVSLQQKGQLLADVSPNADTAKASAKPAGELHHEVLPCDVLPSVWQSRLG